MHVASLTDMPPKQLLFRSEARTKLLRGATALADAVRITLGPRFEVGPHCSLTRSTPRACATSRRAPARSTSSAGSTVACAPRSRRSEETACDGDERTGLKILERALEAPTRTIADNSGYDDGVVVERMRTGAGNQGFDAARGVYCDLVEPASSMTIMSMLAR
jgi:chaperonin GroEL (HSP60 family)